MLSNRELWQLRRNDGVKAAECLKVIEEALKAAVPLPTTKNWADVNFGRVIKISLSLKDLDLDEKENYSRVNSVLKLVIDDLLKLGYLADYNKTQKILEVESRE
jgi:hypothetical protein